MRIEKIRLRNLNSLAGDWVVDFTHPAFAHAGIFAVTGPTGAGKSTLLDALSLGLYGRTPRLDKLSKSGNDLMSTGTGDCLAEVTFSTQKGRFRSFWSQRRARKKPDGELQPPRHELVDADTGAVLENRLKDVLLRVEEATGMDYERFSRSVLLPQGRFADFLAAGAAERAPLLEQITGTEIYRDISLEAHRRARDSRARLDALRAETQDIRLLTEEEEAAVRRDIAENAARRDEADQRLKHTERCIDWLKNCDLLRTQAAEAAALRMEKEREAAAFAPDRERLARAEQALELAGAHATLESSRAELRREEESEERTAAALPVLREQADTARSAQDAAADALRRARTNRDEAALLHTRVRALDVALREKEHPLREAREKASRFAEEISLGEQRLEAELRALDENTAARNALRDDLRATAGDAALASLLPAWQADLSRHAETAAHLAARRQDFDAARESLRRAEEECLRREEALQSAIGDHEQLRRLHEEKERAVAELLAGRTEADWVADREVLEQRAEAFSRAEAAAAATESLAGEIAAHAAARARAEKDSADRNAELEALAAKAPLLEEKVGLREEALHFARRAYSFAEERAALRDGEACPLCGADHHPFALGNIPAPDAARQLLDAAREEMRELTESLFAARVLFREREKDREQAARALADAEARRSDAARELDAALRELGFGDSDGAFREHALRRAAGENARSLAAAKRVLAEAQSLRAGIAGLGSLSASLEQRHALESERDAARHRLDLAGQTFRRLGSECDGFADAAQTLLNSLRGAVRPFTGDPFTGETAAGILASLISRRDDRDGKMREASELEKTVDRLAFSAEHCRGALAAARAEGDSHARILAAREADHGRLAADRAALFGARDVAAEEAALDAALRAAEAAAEASRLAAAGAAVEAAQAEKRLADSRAGIESRRAGLEAAAAEFSAAALAKGFSGEEAYRAALLPEEDRTALRERAAALDTALRKHALDERDLRGRLEKEIARTEEFSAEPADALAARAASIREAIAEFDRAMGARGEKLSANAAAAALRGEKLGAVEMQERECARWEKLHALIGSHDGKKYQVFAQGLTFESMLRAANGWLTRLSDRYVLVRDPEEPLSLCVVDGYQGGVRRTARNVSGGEGFLVSLALALGLSTMAGRNVRVDSLFLDEGFGALDAEALDGALDALSRLRAEGKLVCAISHVPEMKARIPVRIDVLPRADGTSTLSGPGCGA